MQCLQRQIPNLKRKKGEGVLNISYILKRSALVCSCDTSMKYGVKDKAKRDL